MGPLTKPRTTPRSVARTLTLLGLVAALALPGAAVFAQPAGGGSAAPKAKPAAAAPKAKPAAAAPKVKGTPARSSGSRRSVEEFRQRVFGSSIVALQPRGFRKRGRLGVSGAGVMNLNDTLATHLGAGGSLRYHFTERHSLAARGFVYGNIDREARSELKKEQSLFPERTDIRLEAELVYAFSAIDGKFSFFDAGIAHYDLYLQGGAGIIDTFVGGIQPTVLLGVGARVYLLEWLAVEFEVNDSMYMEPYPNGRQLVQNITMGLGIALYVPFTSSAGGSR